MLLNKLLNALNIVPNNTTYIDCNGYGDVCIYHQNKKTIATINLKESVINKLPINDEVPF
jgi:hypothetical protein